MFQHGHGVAVSSSNLSEQGMDVLDNALVAMGVFVLRKE
jgi:hypothetical protein